jgi:hypothetical protein
LPDEGPAFLGEDVRSYQAVYDDRLLVDDRGAWVLASSAAMGRLIYEVSDIIVREIKSPAESAALAAQWDLDPPWRRVTLDGEGLNPDPAAGSPDRVSIAFGPALGEYVVPALRRGNVLLTDGEALHTLEQPLGVLAHRTALTFQALQADTIEVAREGRPLLRGERTGVAQTPEGRSAWLTAVPARGEVDLSETDRHGFTRDLAVNLERIPVLAVLPPVAEPGILEDRERVRVRVAFGTGTEVRTEVFEVGYLAEDRLPAGSPPLLPEEGGVAPVGLWFPAGGKLLQIPSQLLVTARNLDLLLAGDSAP